MVNSYKTTFFFSNQSTRDEVHYLFQEMLELILPCCSKLLYPNIPNPYVHSCIQLKG